MSVVLGPRSGCYRMVPVITASGWWLRLVTGDYL